MTCMFPRPLRLIAALLIVAVVVVPISPPVTAYVGC